MIFTGCKSSKKTHKQDNIDFPTIEIKENKPLKKSIGEKIVKEALTWIGTSYAYGRQDKGVATDCSGLTMVVYEQIANVKIPRNSAKQADFCLTLNDKDVEAGDLVFFATGKDKNKVSHVGIMIDPIRFVHASSSKGVVISDMKNPYFLKTFIKYGRVPLK